MPVTPLDQVRLSLPPIGVWNERPLPVAVSCCTICSIPVRCRDRSLVVMFASPNDSIYLVDILITLLDS